MINPSPVPILVEFAEIILGFLAGVLLPGFLLAWSFEPKREFKTVSYWVVVSAIWGIILDVLLGTVILSVGIGLETWMLPAGSLGISGIVFIGVLSVSHKGIISLQRDSANQLVHKVGHFLVMVILLILGISIGLIWTRNVPKGQNYFTELYLLDDQGQIPGALVDIQTQQPMNAYIVSHEQGTQNFDLVVRIDNEIISHTAVNIDPGETKRISFLILPGYLHGDNPQKLVIELFKDGTVYRRTFLQIQ